ncbi:cytochrome P450 [Dendrothele bispora CBS 962.96]|uniref:Cytochrome P450 n=1 Tax=Dendrothele bispora (strain CBS 962.96) TaxID=1314807 RepID=A0A4S8MUH7_DENBC|nr:cytochrome P450 [Dendrothele bispora CBS 962.96]
MISATTQLLTLFVAVGVLWGLSMRKRSKSNLWKLPGPKSTSWLKGAPYMMLSVVRLSEEHMKGTSRNSRIPPERVNSTKCLWSNEHQLYTFDPKVMHHVLVKPRFINATQALIGSQTLWTVGHHHRKQRKSLNPVFSISHMREMLPVFYEVVNKLQKALIEKVESEPQEVDMLTWISRTALELIGQSGLGYSFDPLTSDATEHTYSQTIKNLIPALQRLPALRFLVLRLIGNIGTPRFRRFLVDSIPLESLQEVKKMSDYMWGLSEEIYESKKQALAAGDEAVTQQVGHGKDIMSILMRGNMNADDDKLDEKEVIAQVSSSTLIFAAMDTTSNALSRILNLLSVHPGVQDKLRKELLEARSTNEELSYDTLVELPYLDAICRETLRLYPPGLSMSRIAIRDISVPLSQPIVGLDGSKITELAISKDTPIVLSFINSNRNPDLWGPDALEWKPERWLSPLPQAVIDAHLPGVYSHLMTFSAGTRSCIGFKFSQLEMKAVLSSLISTFKFALVKDKKITWSQSGLTTPFVEGDTKHPRLPLTVSIADQSKESA